MPDPIDVHVGERVRARRLLAGMSQDAFASKLGITFQQVQKYEKGTNRISASRLYRMAKILNTPISYFFAEMGERQLPPKLRREGLELVRAFNGIESPAMRKQVLQLIEALGDRHAA
ncbi:MAG: helix-turn-helix transcriptional regulator [Rhodothalassiaceae bacterium]